MKKTTAFILGVLMLISIVSCTPQDRPETGKTVTSAAGTTDTDPLYRDEDGVKKIYVSADADINTADGTKEHPYQTLEDAKAAVRATDRSAFSRIDVVVKKGMYFLSSALSLGAEDCGDENCRIRYIGEDGAVISGGLSFTASDFAPVNESFAEYLKDDVKDKIVEIDLKKYGVTEEDVKYGELSPYSDAGMNSLFQDGERLTLARYPNDGLIRIANAVVRENGDYTLTVVKKDYEATKTWHDKENVYVDGYFAYYWSHDISKVLSFGQNRATIIVKNNDQYEPKEGMAFFFCNIAEELDVPGEYFIDKDAMLYYYPKDGFESATIKYPLSKDFLLRVTGNYVTIENLTFENTLSSAIDMRGDNNVILGCLIENTGSHAVIMNGSNNRLDSCMIRSVASHAVSIHGGDRDTLTKANTIAVNNVICNFAEDRTTYEGAFAIDGCGITVTHNEIYGGPHLGITINGNLNVIEYNEIHDLCRFADDSGAVYFGRTYACYGNVMRYNYFHDIGSDDESIINLGGNGIYWDDGLGGQTAYGNVFVNIKGAAYAIGGGPDHIVENNLFINCRTAISYDQRMWDGIFANGWCRHNMGKTIADRNYTSGPWKDAFPTLSQMNYSDEDGKPDDPWFYAMPARSVLRANVAFTPDEETGRKQFDIAEKVLEFSSVDTPIEYGYAPGEQPTVKEALETAGFILDIPFDEMGLLK